MVVIRLSRIGAKKRPFYRIIVADSRTACGGRFIEQIGTFDPLTQENQINLKIERIEHWKKMGARLSNTVESLIKKITKIKK